MRVVAGQWRGTRLTAPDTGVRPTTDRVKEAMFGALHFELPGATVLDLFGGSGALGIEAASRGASSVYIMENDKKARRSITENLKKIGNPPQIHFMGTSYEKALSELKDKVFDIVIMDPPYALGLYEGALRSLEQYKLVRDGTLVVLESDQDLHLDMPGLQIEKTKKYGNVWLTFGRFVDVPAQAG